jgi:hypothetical protein
MNYKDLSSPMFVRSEILRFLLHYYRSITTAVTAAGRYDDTFGYRALFYDLLYVEAEDLDLSYPAACSGQASLAVSSKGSPRSELLGKERSPAAVLPPPPYPSCFSW